jgi:hypothetical protein
MDTVQPVGSHDDPAKEQVPPPPPTMARTTDDAVLARLAEVQQPQTGQSARG